MRYLLFILLSVCTFFCYATVYMKTDSAGNVTYTDVPTDNAQIINEITGNTVPTATTLISSPTNNKPPVIQPIMNEQGNKPYQTFTLISPTDQENIQNQVVIPVKIAIEPELQPGDAIQLIVDGSPWGNPAKTTTLEINLLDRGTHQISAKLIDVNGKVLKETKTVTVYVFRASANFKPNQNSS